MDENNIVAFKIGIYRSGGRRMTDQEAIKELTEYIDCIDLPFGNGIGEEAIESAVIALEEIRQYRAIGTVEEITKINDFFNTQTAKILAKLQEYEKTGLTPQEIMDGKMLTGWIPVEERLPKTEDGYMHVMVSMDDGFVCTTDYTDDGGFELWADSGEVLAWMPLPESYRHKLAEMEDSHE